jgi:hypothetical protein
VAGGFECLTCCHSERSEESLPMNELQVGCFDFEPDSLSRIRFYAQHDKAGRGAGTGKLCGIASSRTLRTQVEPPVIQREWGIVGRCLAGECGNERRARFVVWNPPQMLTQDGRTQEVRILQ